MPLFGRRNFNVEAISRGNEVASQKELIEVASSLHLTQDDVMSSKLTMTRVEKAGYLAGVPENNIGHLYTGDSYVIFCVGFPEEVRPEFNDL